MWITGGDWGEIAFREARVAGQDDFETFEPLLSAVDAVSPDHPVLFRRFDGDYFANSLALHYLRINKNTPNPGVAVRMDMMNLPANSMAC